MRLRRSKYDYGTLATYGRVNKFGFIETRYWKVENGVVKTSKAVYLLLHRKTYIQ